VSRLRCSKISTKKAVDFYPNYDRHRNSARGSSARYPNLLVNGSDGIAVGMATKIPPHNLTEIVDATITLVNNPNAQLPEILKFVQGPDFPTAGIIHGRAGIFEAYRTGRGRFMMRAVPPSRPSARSPGHYRHRDSISGETSAT